MLKKTHTEWVLFYIISALLFISPFVYLKGIYSYTEIPQRAVIQGLSFLALFVALLTGLVSKNRVKVLTHPINIAVILFGLWALVSSFYAVNQYEALTMWSHLVSCIIVFFIVQQLRLSTSTARSLLYVIYAAGVITAIIGICQYFFQLNIIPQSAPPSAMFANKNMAAQFIVLTFPLAVIFKGKRLIPIICSLFMLEYLFLTDCMAAQIAVLLECLLVGFIVNTKRIKKIAKVLYEQKTIVCLVGTFLAIGIYDIGHRVYERPSSMNRIEIWGNTLEIVKDNPVLGVGLGNHHIYYPKYKRASDEFDHELFTEFTQVVNTHNDILQVVSETGVIGGIILISVFVYFFKLVIRSACDKTDYRHFIMLGITAATVGIIVNSCFSFPFQMPIPPLVVAVYMSIGLCLSDHGQSFIQIPKASVIAAVIGLIFSTIYLIPYSFKNIECNKYYLYMKHYEKKKDWKSVILLANRAYKLNPHNKKLLAYSARAYIETGKYQKGVKTLQAVLKAYPYKINALQNLGVAYSRLGQQDKALVCFERVLGIQPDNEKALINTAVVYARLKDYNKAELAFKKTKRFKGR